MRQTTLSAFLGGVLLFATGLTQAAAADCAITWCIKCGEDGLSRLVASDAASAADCVYAVDKRAHKVRFFRIRRELHPDRALIEGVKAAPDAGTLADIRRALSVTDALSSLDAVGQLHNLQPGADFDSAIDLAGMPDRQKRLAEAMSEYVRDRSESALDADILQQLFKWPWKSPQGLPVHIVTVLSFPDGSSGAFRVTGVRTDAQGKGEVSLEYMPEQAQDADGRRIPWYPDALPDRGIIVGASAKEYREFAERNGVTVKLECGSCEPKFQCQAPELDGDAVSCTYSSDTGC